MEQFKRDTTISPLRVFVPDLFDRLFTEGYVPPDAIDDLAAPAGMFTPTTSEEFDMMFEEWADLGQLDLSGVFKENLTTGSED